ncbi:MAG TPA: folylpolyglutamate synthase/dihydrofolate synthase family protein [Stellaceae bacterium]|jgi:dihydrofolate synthase/folylpolyglutamate synthase|nr:folylpolyglutamate synthase/dihydrofolate synthase family protein [Stellaceae bacterium]
MVAAGEKPTDRVLARLMQLHPKKIDLSLGRTEHMLALVGNPHERLPPTIHVAGTNGKGSTVATMRACLEAAGYRVHVYTSPHLVRFNERIRLAGRIIDEDALLDVLEECERANAGAPITFFEITTAAAFLAFARTPADFVLLETGLGGRHDSTNVIRRPAATAITPISLDHQAFLGDTIAAIAGEKAGILKPGAPGVIGPQLAEAAAVFEARAAEIGAPLHRWNHEWRCEARGDGVRYEGSRWRLDLPLPSLLGAHQIDNAGTAIACLEQLDGVSLPGSAIADGLRHIEWAARLQHLTRGPLVAMLPPGWELWLDGGHNPGAGAVLAAAAAKWRDRPLDLIVGMLKTKDAGGFLAPLVPHTRSLRAVTIPGEENPHPATLIAASARTLGILAEEAPSIETALHDIIDGAKSDPARVLICGSLHFAGVALAQNG